MKIEIVCIEPLCCRSAWRALMRWKGNRPRKTRTSGKSYGKKPAAETLRGFTAHVLQEGRSEFSKKFVLDFKPPTESEVFKEAKHLLAEEMRTNKQLTESLEGFHELLRQKDQEILDRSSAYEAAARHWTCERIAKLESQVEDCSSALRRSENNRKQERARAKSLLESIEWSWQRKKHTGLFTCSWNACPLCGGAPLGISTGGLSVGGGHAADCKLARMLLDLT